MHMFLKLIFLFLVFEISSRAVADEERSTSGKDLNIEAFASCADLEKYIEDQVLVTDPLQPSRVNLSRLGIGRGAGSGTDMRSNFGGPSGAFGGASHFGDRAPINFTTTNNQIAGIQEADLIKTNGRYLFQAAGEYIHITKIWPVKELGEVFRIRLNSQVEGLLLDKNQLFVFSQQKERSTKLEMLSKDNIGPVKQENDMQTRMMVFDIANPEAPVLVRSQDYLGLYTDARFINEEIVLLMKNYIKFFGGEFSQPRTEENKKILKAMFESIDINGWLGTNDAKDDHCRRYFGSKNSSDLILTRLLRINPSSYKTEEVNLFSSHTTHYVSQSAVYLFDLNGVTHSTEVFRLPFKGFGGVARGNFAGSLVNSFAADEYKGYLRVAVTTKELENFILVLKPSEKGFSQIGKSPKLAPTETIRSVRYAGDTSYLVTFRVVDPLFILDLSSPHAPKLLGELKVPGYSTYIHPIKDDRLLTVGVSTDSNFGRNLGIKISLFDIRNKSAPKELDSFESKVGERSQAVYNHHAFTYDSVTATLAIPISRDYNTPSRLSVFQISDRNQIDHRGDLKMTGSSRASEVSRSVVAEDFIYAISNLEVAAASIAKPDEKTANVFFSEEGKFFIPQSPPKMMHRATVNLNFEKAAITGGITKMEVLAVTRAHLNQIRHCYEQLLQRSQNSKGTLLVEFMLRDSGETASVQVGGNMKDNSFTNCIRTRIQRWRFPKPRGKAPTKVSQLEFSFAESH
jgi:inhibitor of cysteine peptidase